MPEDTVEYVTFVLKMPRPLTPNAPWPKLVRSLLTDIGHPQPDGLEVVAFTHGNALASEDGWGDFLDAAGDAHRAEEKARDMMRR